MKWLFFTGILGFMLVAGHVCAGEKSDKMRPCWLRTLPRPGNSSYYFKVVYSDVAPTLNEARLHARKGLALSIGRNEHMKIDESLEYHSIGSEEMESLETGYSFQVESKGEDQYLRYERIDEYWETGDEGVVRLYTLFAVGRQAGPVKIDRFRKDTQYGARGLIRSVSPGWGQMYKGSMVKGGCILGGEIALIGAVISAENLRASYVKKMRENPRQMKTYNTKADNWQNIRNVCIGAAAALYVYNLIDAIVAPGAPRLVLDRPGALTFKPIVAPDYNGISLVFKF